MRPGPGHRSSTQAPSPSIPSPGLDAREAVPIQAYGDGQVGDGEHEAVEAGRLGPGPSVGLGRGDVRREGLGAVVVALLGELHDDAAGVGREQERLLPPRVRAVDAGRAGCLRGSSVASTAVEVGHLEGDVVGAGAVAVEEALQEVELVDAGRLEALDRHAVGEADLGPVEAGRWPAADGGAAEIADVAGPQVVDVPGSDGDVVEVEGFGHGRDHGRRRRSGRQTVPLLP